MSDIWDDGSKYKNYTEQEWKVKKSFSFDDHNSFSDLKILKMQNIQRFLDMEKVFGLPVNFGFCRDFCVNNNRNRLLQRHLCQENCFWNPRVCLLDQTHSGNLLDLMKKSFHDTFNPAFSSQFHRVYTGKIDWSLNGGVGNFPSFGLKKLIEDLGITSKISYDSDGIAVNLDNLSREFWDSDPVRPLYIMEEKRIHDIMEALLNVNSGKIENNRKEMQTIYDESFKANGPLREPILSLMMWGPLDGYDMRKKEQRCHLDHHSLRPGYQICLNFSEKHFWMYSHGDQVDCSEGKVKQLSGPAMTYDMKVIYPCNRSACNQGCECGFCDLSSLCLPASHKQHLKDSEKECIVQKQSQCQDHWVGHPDNFAVKEDILIEKNIFYHNGVLEKEPRKNVLEALKFSGIKKKCKTCCRNVQSHLKFHKVIHLQCKFCLFQLKTMFDKKFWEKVCNSCGKIILDTSSRQMYWHKKIHSLDWSCEDCDLRLNRKWNFKRHLMEVHGLEFHQIDDSFESPSDKQQANDIADGEKSFSCSICKQSFKTHENLKKHVSEHSIVAEKHACDICDKTFTRKDTLQQHINIVHLKEDVSFPCQFCGQEFTRKHNLTRHERRVHGGR
jgi:uncharacterized C2H2 Zn-finger protein